MGLHVRLTAERGTGSLLLLPTRAAEGAANMAFDEASMELARAGTVALRFYAWRPACLSLGRNQPTGPRVAGRSRDDYAPGVDVVRRPTAGRSVYHGPELTYAIVAPERLWGGPKTIYARVHAALAEGLAEVGVRLDRRPGVGVAGSVRSGKNGGTESNGEAGESVGTGASLGVGESLGAGESLGTGLAVDGRACFVAPAPGELTAGGHKLVGSAQWRHRGVLLQHGSILLSDGQATVEQVRRRPRLRSAASAAPSGGAAAGSTGAPRSGGPVASAARSAEATAVGLEELLGRRPALAELREALLEGFRAKLGAEIRPVEVTRAEREAAERLEARYLDDAWTWSR